jgi:hypothetical protein
MTTPIDRPYGFRPVTKRGESWCGTERAVVFSAGDAVAAFIGSMVKFTGTSEIIDGKSYAVVAVAEPADTRLAGAVTRFQYDPDGYLKHRPASTQRIAYIPQDRDVLYSVQEDGDTTPLTAGAVEANIDFTAEVGDTVTSQSTMELNSDTVNTTATLPLRIVELEALPGNDLVGSGGVNPQWVVAINQDAYSDKAGL